MLRKRSRSLQKDQYKGNRMPDSAPETCFQSDVLSRKHKNTSFFGVPGLFIGFTSKVFPDSDSVSSPTSPLDFKVFSNSPRSSSDGSQKRWDCSKVGLSIVDSLSDETKPSGNVLGKSRSKNIIFGSQMKINNPNPQTLFSGSNYSFTETKSLPKNYAIPLNGSETVFEAGEIKSEPIPFQKNQSSLLDQYHNCNLSSENFWEDKKISRSGSPPLINSLGVKPNSLPIFIDSANGIFGSLSASEIELSEDYTCVISHGPNPRTTHIFGDCILECHTNKLTNFCKKDEQGIGSPQIVKNSDGFASYSVDDFLSYCFSCKKKLEEGKDIYIYRGEKAFCSTTCRSQEILVEEEMEKTMNNSSEDSPKSTDHEEFFLEGMVVAT